MPRTANAPGTGAAGQGSPHFSQPYYAFESRLRIGWGLDVGYPVRYPFGFAHHSTSRESCFSPSCLADRSVAANLDAVSLAAEGERPLRLAATSGVSFQITPDDAALFVDGVYVGAANEFSATSPPLTLSPGPHHVALKARAYRPMAFDVDVLPGQVLPYQGTMQARVVGPSTAARTTAPAPLPDREVARAIARADKLTSPAVCVGRNVPGEFTVCLQGPEQRIGVAAAAARHAHRPLRPTDVSAELRTQAWTVVARPHQPALVDGRAVRTPLAEELMLELPGRPEWSFQPLQSAPIPVAWDNAIGMTLTGQGLTATFDPSLPPAGDLELVIVVGNDERRYVLSAQARAQIR